MFDIHHTATAQFSNREQAEDCIRKLRHSGFDIRLLTLIGKGYFTQQKVLGFYTVGDRIKNRGVRWAINGGIWGLFFAVSYLLLDGYRDLEIFPWLVLYLAACWAFIFGIVGALWGGFSGFRFSARPRLKYSTRFKASSYILVAAGDESQIERFRELLDLHLPKDVIEKEPDKPVEL